MNTTIFKKISETIKMNVTQVPHPTLVGIGISLGVTLAVGLAISFAMAPHDASAIMMAMTSRGARGSLGTGMGHAPPL